MSYDRTEAKALFVRSHEKRDPRSHSSKRNEAAHALLKGVILAAAEAGYETGPERGMQVISHLRQGAVYLWVADDALCIGREGGKRKGDLPIEYDASLGMFVGRTTTCSTCPSQGSRSNAGVRSLLSPKLS